MDVTAYVAEETRRTGVGRLLYKELLTILERQLFRAAYARIALPNPGSVGLHKEVGFEPIGIYHEVGFKHGAWHDVGWWRCALNRQDPPSEPISFRKL